MEEKIICALCGFERKATSGAYRWVYKRYKRLVPGYYQPRLSVEEIYSLPSGEQPICINRQACRDRQIG